MEQLQSWLSSVSDLINALSLIVSLVTLITMLCFKRRVRKAFEKKDFESSRKHTLKVLNGYVGSLSEDELYDEKFLKTIDLSLSRIRSEFTFFPIVLRLLLLWASFYIHHFCLPEIQKGKNKHVHALRLKLNKISVLVGKE